MGTKKSSFGRTIFILILLIILIAGGYFGYKYYLDQNTSTTSLTEDIDFQIAGTWYVNDSGEAYSDNAFNFSEYNFESPTRVDGKFTGKLNVVTHNLSNPLLTGDYEVVGENKLKISFPNEMDYEFTYTYYPDEQKLEMDFAGQNRTLIREKPVVQESTPQTEEEIKAEEEKVQTQLWMDNIADVIWENSNWTVRFDKPVQEGDIITGEMIENKYIIYKYERISDGEVKCKSIFYLDGNGNRIKYDGSEFTLKMELQDDGNTLIFYHSDGRVLRFTRS